MEIEPSRFKERVDPVKFGAEFKKFTHFQELGEDWVVLNDPVGFTNKIVGEIEETYGEKQALGRRKGATEAASYGLGRIDLGRRKKQEFVGIIFNWEYMGGSAGAVVGKKMREALKLAEEKNLPVVALYSTGGQRQQEAAAALREMLKTARAISKYKNKVNKPLVSVIVGDVWGGISASAVTFGEPVISIDDSNFGFSGRSATGTVPDQTAKNTFLTNREVQVILNNPEELKNYLKKYFSILNGTGQPSSKTRRIKQTTGLEFDKVGTNTPIEPHKSLLSHDRATLRHIPSYFSKRKEPIQQEEIYLWYDHILREDPRRPDTLYMLLHAFDGFIPFFSGIVTDSGSGKHLQYPAIIAALAYIDDPRLKQRLTTLVIGNQPSYFRNDLSKGVITKLVASPTAWDFRYKTKMLRTAERFGYQVTTFVDNIGARTTRDDYDDAQYAAIADDLYKQGSFPFLTSVYNLGISGSGGGIASGCYADHVVMLEDAHEYVAAPDTAAKILRKDAMEDDNIRIAAAMKPTARFLRDLGLVDDIIPVPTGGAQKAPYAIARAVRENIILFQLECGYLTPEEIEERRDERIQKQQPFEIGRLSELKPEHPHRKALKRFSFTKIKIPH